MIAFTSVFLMKVATKWNAVGFNVDPAFVWNLLDKVIHLLKTTITSKRHLLYHIAAGLEKLRARLLEQDGDSRPGTGVPLHTPRYGQVDEPPTPHLSYVASQRPNVVPPDDCAISSWADDSQITASDLTMANDPRRRVVTEPDTGLDQVMSMSNDLIYEVFGGNESSYDVYSLLSSQFAS
ncbi:hypothetical protein N7512_003648 [Penicillium capsulatum]|nr:hypothetical protein N7512_003648 [Penicillium capsulatum]